MSNGRRKTLHTFLSIALIFTLLSPAAAITTNTAASASDLNLLEAPQENEAAPDQQEQETEPSNNEETEPYIVLEDFEDGIGTWKATGARYNSVDALLTNDTVRFGSSALQLDYDFIGTQGTSGVYASKDSMIEIPDNPEKIGMGFMGTATSIGCGSSYMMQMGKILILTIRLLIQTE
ncbi:hypothetical protein [Salibacterium sp. K-3]